MGGGGEGVEQGMEIGHWERKQPSRSNKQLRKSTKKHKRRRVGGGVHPGKSGGEGEGRRGWGEVRKPQSTKLKEFKNFKKLTLLHLIGSGVVEQENQ